ncbi:restriction endonuclease [Sphingomonas sp. RT2P30]|uniref:nSTAND3 domain-containing NTPase n=1 Tax=Parasphingomonas halimpatiens TaxID=3096162 RepID=UPI002FCA5323
MYDFHDLSPLDFEELVRDLLQAELGIHLESFGPGRDSGIDCRHASDGNKLIVQAKHYLRSGSSKLLSALKAEDLKVAKLAPTRYIVATSVSMTPAFKDAIIAAMPSTPLASSDIFGQEDLNNLLSKHSDIEKKHFKLWLGSTSILERIIHSGIYNRTETELALIKAMIPRFVQNDSVKAAEDVLAAAGTLIVAGHPGVGKTTLARMLVWLHAAQDWKIFVVDDIEEAFEISNPGEKRLIFFDDFLGQVRLSADHVRGLDSRLPPFLERVKANKDLRFILTTREYILSQAELLSRRLASRQMSANRYVLNVGIYTRAVRAQILYNHLYFSGLRDDQIYEILLDDFYMTIIDHPNFNPRLIELLTSEEYSSLTGQSLRTAIERVLDNPEELWERPYRDHISADGRALMLAMLLHPSTASLETLRTTFVGTAAAIGYALPAAQLQPRFAAALKELEGSVLAIVNQTVRFSNPGVRDFLQVVAISDNLLPSLVDKVVTLTEVKQCWTIFFDREPRPTPRPSDARVWVDALARVEPDGVRNDLDQFELALAMYDHFSDPGFLAIARDASARIAVTGFDASNVRAAISALEMILLHSLPIAERDHFHELLTKLIADILKNYVDELPFEDIEALDDVLFTFGSDTAVAGEAIRTALNSFIPDIDNEMMNYGSLDELDDFERRLKGLIERRGYSGHSPERDIRARAESG